MANKKERIDDNGEVAPQETVNITPEIQKQIADLIFQQRQMAADKEAFGEAATKIADQLGIKPAVLKRRVSMIIKEEDEGGEVKSKSQDILFVEQYSTVEANSKHS